MRILLLHSILLIISVNGVSQNKMGIKQALVSSKINNPTIKVQRFDILATETDITTYHCIPSIFGSKKNLENYSSIISKSEKVLKIIRQSYISGNTSIIDYLEAQDTWYDTQKLYYEALRKYRESYMDVLHTTGLIEEIMQ